MNDARKHAETGNATGEGSLTRRDVLTAAAAVVGASAGLMGLPKAARGQTGRVVKNGRIKQSICGGCLRGMKLDQEQTASLLVEMGLVGRDLVGRNDWDVLKKHDLVATMVPGAGSIKQGLNDKSMHPKFMESFRTNIKAAAEYKWPNVICMAGDRAGIGEEEGMDNCQAILKEAVKIAEDHGVTICMELLNSKVDHPGYMCDNYPWAFELCRRVDSPRFKMLFDIYHMQIMEGDVIRTIQQHIQWIGHFHTAGNPGRRDFDDTQELNYAGICAAIAATLSRQRTAPLQPASAWIMTVRRPDRFRLFAAAGVATSSTPSRKPRLPARPTNPASPSIPLPLPHEPCTIPTCTCRSRRSPQPQAGRSPANRYRRGNGAARDRSPPTRCGCPTGASNAPSRPCRRDRAPASSGRIPR